MSKVELVVPDASEARRYRATAGPWLLTALGLSAAIGCSKESPEEEARIIEIGLLVEFEEPSDTEEEIAKANLVANEINDAGGISIDGKDYELRFVAEDHQGSVRGSIEAIELLKSQGVTAIVGPPWSSLALGDEADGSDGAAIAARDAGILMISGSATSPALSTLEDDDLFWRTAPSDALQAVLAADYLLNEKGVSRAAILSRDEAWGRGLSAAFAAAFTSGGGEIVGTASYDVSGSTIPNLDTYEYEAELDAIFAEKPDVILLVNFDEVFQISNRIVQGEYLSAYADAPPLFFGADATFAADLLGNAAPQVLRHMEGVTALADREGEDFTRYAAKVASLNLSKADSFDTARYDAAYCVALAMQAAQSIDANVVKTHLRAVANADDGDVDVHVNEWGKAKEALLSGEGINYEGASGPIEFDANGDPSVGFFVLFKVVETTPSAFRYDLSNNVRFPSEP